MRLAACGVRLAVVAMAMGGGARAAEVRFDGAYQLRLAFNSNLTLDDAATRLGQTGWAEHRLRLTPKIVEAEKIEIQAQFDVVSGLIAGDLAPGFGQFGWTERAERNGVRARGFDFRYAFAALRLPVGILQIGQMPNHWGMGLVSNNGEFMDSLDFGDLRFGDIVDGFLFGTKPFAFLGPRSELGNQIVMAVAGQIVYRDRFASLVVRDGGGLAWGDLALQAVGVLRWEPSESTRVGFYAARRVQSYAADAGNLHVWVFDAHARTEIQLPSIASSIRLEIEGAEVYGGTSHAANLNSLGEVRVAQQGLAARATFNRGSFEGELEVGYASGDENPFDGAATGFISSRDYKVGLVLWDEVMLFQTQNGARRLGDPNLVGRPPPGVDLFPTQGSITNALYLNPRLRWRQPLGSGSLRAVAGLLWTRAPKPVVDPYQSFLASAPRNAFGMPGGQSYGTELDLALSWRVPLSESRKVGLDLGAQWGVLLPGDVFTRADGSIMPAAHAFKLRTTLFF